MKIKALSLFLGASLASLAVAQPSLCANFTSPKAALVALDGEQAEEGERLKLALGAITENNLISDLNFIASDEMAGRDTPSDEQRMAARFIRARLMRLGFTPAGDEGSYLHTYELSNAGLDVERAKATLERDGDLVEWELGKQYYLSGRAAVGNSSVAAGMIFGGSGRADELKDIEVKGKWVLVIEEEGLSSTTVLENVRSAGGVGLLVASHPDKRDGHSAQRAARVARWLGSSSLSVVQTEVQSIFPRLFISAEALEDLTFGDVPQVGTDLELVFSEQRSLVEGSEIFEVENVAGLWPGSDPKLAKEVLIISAHYDHIGHDEEGIFNGADDNGSGTCGLMAIAEALKAYGPMKRSVLLLWVSGEEKGLLGSEAWTKNPTLPESLTAVCDLNIDMIGRNAPDYLLITPTASHPAYNGLTRMAEKYGPMEGFPSLGSADEYWSRSDHANFSQNMEIPVAFLFSDVHDDYHQRSDTIEKIDFNKIKRISSMVVRMLDELQDMDLSVL